ncbi:MAG: NADH-quinone oxidoreductase subunit NuoH [Anaerolineae bacterium]|nr:NADH-quinone oxidoreductase subunit NuoH [Anaerolineae bacterium]
MGFLDTLPITIMEWLRTTLSQFLPLWGVELVVALLKVVLVLVLAIMPVIVLTWMERKVLARSQDRFGPNVAGPYGLIVAFADAIKILTKEDVTPAAADRRVFKLAPAVVIIPTLLVFTIIPVGRGLVAADLNVGILFAVAVASINIIAVLAATWSSGNKYSLIATFRSVAQLISYEIPMAFSILAVVLASGGLSTVTIVESQTIPYAIVMPVAAAIYFLAALAEANRSPFDLLMGESEIVAGFNLEYSGMRFAMFYIGEYAHIFIVGALTATLFLGGYRGPILPGYIWFFVKSFAVVFVVLWIRATWPRMRIDQLLDFAWKLLIPISLAHLMLVALMYKIAGGGVVASLLTLAGNVVLLAVVAASLVWRARQSSSRRIRALVLGEV